MSVQPLRDTIESLERQTPRDDTERATLRLRAAAQLRSDWLGRPRPPSRMQGQLSDDDDPSEEALFRERHPLAAWFAELSPQAAPTSELARLAQVLGLSPIELDVVDMLFAVGVDPGLATLLAPLDSHGRGVPTAALCARLFGHGRALLLTETSALRLWGLVREHVLTPGDPAVLVLDPAMLAWLCGHRAPEDALAGLLHDEPRREPLANWPVAATARAISENLQRATPRPVRVSVRGQAGGGRTSFARAVAGALGLPLIAVDADPVTDDVWADVHRLAHRRAFLSEAAVAWRGRTLPAKPWAGRHACFPIEFLILEPGQTTPARPDAPAEIEVDLTAPTPDERRALWLSHIPAAASWPSRELERLAAYEVQPAEIAAVARRQLADANACIAALRVNLPAALRDFAELPDCTFRWDDLVVAPPVQQALDDFTFEARARGDLWRQAEARRLFPQGRALVGLFSGPPGTGKTMAAQVIAADLGLTLCRVNLATITSKWVGETSQRVDAVFRFCAGRNTLLLIDEADALCGRRIEETSDAQDAHVNRDISHLMMAIENHDGVVILTTNLKGNLDPAFLRRLRHCVEFRKPTAEERRSLWLKMIGSLCGRDRADALASHLGPLSEIEATGAQIKNAVLSAHFAAVRDRRPAELSHLTAGIDREFRKEGYGLSASQIAQASHG
jgi:AAA+ superfamily predicted ATPase